MKRSDKWWRIILTVGAAAVAFGVMALGPCDAAEAQSQAVAECQHVWQRINADTYTPELAAFFVEIHRRAGVEDRWLHSLVFCWSGADLKPTMVSRGTINGEHARGLCDTLWSTHRGHYSWVKSTVDERGLEWNEQVLHDPYVAIRLHVIELMECHDYDPWRNLRRVFLPRSPDGRRARQEQSGRWDGRYKECQDWLSEFRDTTGTPT